MTRFTPKVTELLRRIKRLSGPEAGIARLGR